MKTRNGFVSNSSTSSFLIAVPRDVPEYYVEYLKLFEKIFSEFKEDKYRECCIVDYDTYISNINSDIKELEEEYESYIKTYNRVAEFMGNRTKQAAVDQFIKIGIADKHMKESKYGLKYCGFIEKVRPMNEIQADLQNKMKKLKSEIDEYKSEIDIITPYKDAKYICKFNVDANGGSCDSNVMERIIDSGIVKLIKKVTS